MATAKKTDPVIDPVDQTEEKPLTIQQATTAALKDFDIFQVRIKKVNKEDRRTRQQWTEIEGFELYRKKKTVRVEPQVASDLNAYAEGIPSHNDFGELYMPAGKYKDGDQVSFPDVYPDKDPVDNMYRVIPQANQ